jgi:uncharacterized protein with NRDE domain
MCLALIAIGQHPLYPLIILSNRDEFYKRATLPAHYWPENPNVFSGKDLIGGGTWLGVNKNGNFSLITNYRNPKANDLLKQSRGLLTKNFLLESIHTVPAHYIKTIAESAHNYNPFNLIVGNRTRITYYSSVINKMTELTTGLYGISNHLLDTSWYKVLRAKSLFAILITNLINYEDPHLIEDLLFPILEDRILAPDHLLPDTGVPRDIEKSLSSIFVDIPSHRYGTRSSTILLFNKDNIYFSEKTFINTRTTSSIKTNVTIAAFEK